MNNIRLTLEFDISQGKKGWNDFLSYGKNVKEQMNGLFISPTEFSGFGAINKEAVTAGAGVDELLKKIQALETQLEKLRTKSTTGTGMPQFTQLTGNARMAVSSFNYTLQDAGMFFVNFRMGMMSISNNVPMLIQGLVGMKKEAIDGNKSFKQYIKESFSGPNAFLPVISLVSVAMIALPAIFDKIKESSKQAAEEGIRKLTKELEGLSSVQLTQKLEDTKAEMMQFALDMIKMRGILGPISDWFSDDDVKLEAKIKELGLLKDEKSRREDLNKTILGRLDLEEKEIKYKKSQTNDEKELLKLNNELEVVSEQIRVANMSSKDIAEEEKKLTEERMKLAEKERKEWEARKKILDYIVINSDKLTIAEKFAKVEKSGENLNKIIGASKFTWTELENQLQIIEKIISKLPPEVKIGVSTEINKIREDIRKKRYESESELRELQISNIKWEMQREIELVKFKYQQNIKKINDEVRDESLKFQILAELYVKYLGDLSKLEEKHRAEYKNAEADKNDEKLDKEFNMYKAMYESAADVLRSEVGKAWQDIFGEANSLLEKYAQNLLSTFLDAALNEAAKKLFSGGGGRGGRAKEWYEYIPVIGSFFGFFGGGGDASPAGAPKRIDGTGNETVDTAVLNRSLMPSANEVRVITMQPDMSVVRDEIRSWAKEVNFSWAYNEWRAGMKTLEHRDSFEE